MIVKKNKIEVELLLKTIAKLQAQNLEFTDKNNKECNDISMFVYSLNPIKN